MKREHLYVERKHPCVWLMALCMAASAVPRVTQYNGNLWLEAMSITAAVGFALIAMFSGDEMMYRTAVPLWLLGISIAIFSGSMLIWIVAVCMTVKKELTSDAPDSLIKVHLHPADTAADVYRKFNEKVEEAKNEMETTADSAVVRFMSIPRLVRVFL